MWETLRRWHHSEVDWIFDRPWLFYVWVALVLVLAFLAYRNHKRNRWY